MKIELNRRSFLAVLGAATATLSTAGLRRSSVRLPSMGSGTPLHFLSDLQNDPPARPKTMAINYLSE